MAKGHGHGLRGPWLTYMLMDTSPLLEVKLCVVQLCLLYRCMCLQLSCLGKDTQLLQRHSHAQRRPKHMAQ